MAVVVDLDAFRRLFQSEDLGHAFQQPALAGALGQPAAQSLAGIGHGMFDQFALFAATGHAHRHLAAGTDRQCLGEQRLARSVVTQQNHARWLPVLVELGEKGIQHLFSRQIAVMARKIGTIAPVLAGADEKDLDADLAPFRPGREQVGL